MNATPLKTDNSYSYIDTTNLILVLITFVIGLFLVLQRVDKYIKIKAVDDCIRVSRSEDTLKNDRKVVYPLKDVYEYCLKDKGYTIEVKK